MQIRDRIKDFRRVRAGDLRPHPKNWRTHPEKQQNALRGILAEVGYVDALMVRELPDGSRQIVDGHLRADPALIGNRLAKVINCISIPPCSGCEQRRQWLNKAHASHKA